MIINLTPHAITVVSGSGEILRQIPASGNLARVSARTVATGEMVDGIPVTTTSYGEVEGLPSPQEGVIYIVSALVAGRVPDRRDVFIPNESVRDSEGRIIGCKSLGRI